MNCYYCQENDALNKQVTNPHTKEIHPTCLVCEYSFDLLRKDMQKFKIVKTLGNIFLVSSIIVLFIHGWFIALICILFGFSIKFLSGVLVGNNASKRQELEAIFAEKNNLFSFHLDLKK